MLFSPGSVVLGGYSGVAGHVTLTPVYWAPVGYSFSAGYKAIINGYLANVAADSHQSGNVFSVSTQYYQQLSTGGPIQHIDYQVAAGAEIDDATAFPTDCTPAGGFSACVGDAGLQAELQARLSALGRPINDQNLYLVMFPAAVETCVGPSECSSNVYCAYHSGAFVNNQYLVYGNEPFPDLQHCAGGQAPNGDPAADAQVSLISHEANESITDFTGAWFDSAGYENGDECAYIYGTPLGTAGAYYNQVIGSGRYLHPGRVQQRGLRPRSRRRHQPAGRR